MKKFFSFLCAAIMMVGVNAAFCSCDSDDDDSNKLNMSEYTYKCKAELIDQGTVTDEVVQEIIDMFDGLNTKAELPSKELAIEYMEVVLDDFKVFIKAQGLYEDGVKYKVHVTLYDASKNEITSRTLIVDGANISLEVTAK
jgi:hypothetical protein